MAAASNANSRRRAFKHLAVSVVSEAGDCKPVSLSIPAALNKAMCRFLVTAGY